jgi:hypothetical protein
MKHYKLVFLFAGIVIVSLSATIAFAMDDPIDFKVIHLSHAQGPPSPTYLAIRSQDEWITYWNSSDTSSLTDPLPGQKDKLTQTPARVPAPHLDFRHFTLLIAASGTKPHSGHSLAFTSVRANRSATIVFVLEIDPGKNCPTYQEITTGPIAFALIPRTNLPVHFVVSQAEVDCASRKTVNVVTHLSNYVT